MKKQQDNHHSINDQISENDSNYAESLRDQNYEPIPNQNSQSIHEHPMKIKIQFENCRKMVYLGMFKLQIKEQHWEHCNARFERETRFAQQLLINKYLFPDAEIKPTKYYLGKKSVLLHQQDVLMVQRGDQINMYEFASSYSFARSRLINSLELGIIEIKGIEPLPKPTVESYAHPYCIALSLYTSSQFLDFCNQHYEKYNRHFKRKLLSSLTIKMDDSNRQDLKKIDCMIEMLNNGIVTREQMFQESTKSISKVKGPDRNYADRSEVGDMQEQFVRESIKVAKVDHSVQSSRPDNRSVISFSFIMEGDAGKYFDLSGIDIPEASNPQGFRGQLLPFQKKALTWMLHREGYRHCQAVEVADCPYWTDFRQKLKLPFDLFCNNREYALVSGRKMNKICHGGILADEMGLGKTIMLISLMLAHVPNYKSIQKQTLIIAPKSLIGPWQQKIKQFAPQLKTLIFYGKNCRQVILKDYDVIITTQSKLRSIVNHAQEGKQNNETVILQTQWFRIIVDEAHNFRNSSTKMAQALCQLNARYRWALTGTPTQNSLSDMYSLLKFLRVFPWRAEFYWLSKFPAKPADVETHHFYLLKEILKGIMLRRRKKSKNEQGEQLLKLPDLKMDYHYVQMSEKTKQLYRILQAKAEKDYHKLQLLQKMNFAKEKKEVKKVMSDSKRNMVNMIFAMLMKMRQLCCHQFLANYTTHYLPSAKFQQAYLRFRGCKGIKRYPKINFFEIFLGIRSQKLKHTLTSKLQQVYPYWHRKFDAIEQGHKQPCFICGNPNPTLFTPCLHLFCSQCINSKIKAHRSQSIFDKAIELRQLYESLSQNNSKSWVKPLKREKPKQKKLQEFKSSCPACRQPLYKRELFALPKENQFGQDFDNFKPNEKLRELSAYIYKMKPREKAIIYTSFLGMIRLLEFTVTKMGYGDNYRSLTGADSVEDRIRINEEFNNNFNIRFLIITLKVGAVGLNLQIANWIFLMDPWWNPAIEDQAIGRAYRFGQKLQVNVIKFITKNSVQARITKINFTKKSLIDRLLDIDDIENYESFSSKRAEIRYLLQVDEGTDNAQLESQINSYKIEEKKRFIEELFEEFDEVRNNKKNSHLQKLKIRLMNQIEIPRDQQHLQNLKQELKRQGRQIQDEMMISSDSQEMEEDSDSHL